MDDLAELTTDLPPLGIVKQKQTGKPTQNDTAAKQGNTSDTTLTETTARNDAGTSPSQLLAGMLAKQASSRAGQDGKVLSDRWQQCMIAATALDRVGDVRMLRDPLAATVALATALEGVKDTKAVAKIANMVEDRLLAIAEVHEGVQKIAQSTQTSNKKLLIA